MFVFSAALNAQQPPPSPLHVYRSLSAMASSSSSDHYSEVSIAAIKNRARTLGDAPSGSGTRYFEVTDLDLNSLSASEILRRLSPESAREAADIRLIDIVVDLRRPLLLYSKPGQPVTIGTAVLSAAEAAKTIQVNSIIVSADITVVGK
jgi:hypothetical protein